MLKMQRVQHANTNFIGVYQTKLETYKRYFLSIPPSICCNVFTKECCILYIVTRVYSYI